MGHNSEAGPRGDPNGDTAAWFEGSDAMDAGPCELVIYDTAAGREISRTTQAHGVTQSSGDHYPAGNRFLQVSAERVVWSAWANTYSHDVRTQTTSVVKSSVADMHDDIEVLREDRGIVLRVPGRAEEHYLDLETHLRLSPGGNYVLAVEGTETRHAAAIVDTRTGDLWRVPRTRIPGSPGRTATSPWWTPRMHYLPETPPAAHANPGRPSAPVADADQLKRPKSADEIAHGGRHERADR